MNIMVLTKFASETAKVCPSLILVSLPYLLLLVSLNYLSFSMYPKFKKILSLLTSLLVIIKCLLNFIPLFFVSRIYTRGPCFSKGPVRMASTPRLLLPHCVVLLLPSSENESLFISGIIALVTLLLLWFSAFCLGLAFLSLPPSSLLYALRVNKAKLHKLHFGLTFSISKHPLDLMFLDVWGPTLVVSSNGHRYFLSVVDDFSKYIWFFPMACKSDVTTIFIKFKRIVENFFSHSIKSIQTDGEGEFIPLQRFLHTAGISYYQTCPHTHHQNGSVERRHRHIVDTGLTLLAHSNVPFKYWDDAFDTACYVINRLPSLTRPKSPFELLFNKLPNYTFLKTFGCECWPYLRPYNSHKFSYRSKSCFFLGYNKPHLGYKCLDLSTRRLYIARHVIFNEQVFPFKSVLGPPPSSAPCQPILCLPTCISPPLLY